MSHLYGSLTIALIIGTRPEAIKMAPVYRALAQHPDLTPILVSTGQHTDLLRTALDAFGLVPDHELGVMTHAQSLSGTAARILDRLPPLLNDLQPAAVLVQGDTTTALAAGLPAFYQKIPVGHIEAGLRTYDFDNPFPEEANRQLVDRISRWCFSPTEAGRENLVAERVDPAKIHVTGNTGIDALLWALERAAPRPAEDPFVLMTLHRRESFGEPFRDILGGLLDFLTAAPDAQVIWPVHPNPAVVEVANEVFGGNPRIKMIPPQDYLTFAGYLVACRVVLTDSGGIQEETTCLGVPCVTVRENTERPVTVERGTNTLSGVRTEGIREAVRRQLSKTFTDGAPQKWDGKAAIRTVDTLADAFRGYREAAPCRSC